MLITALKSKIHRATVTATELDYEGSIAIDKKLLQSAQILVNEQVQVLNLNTGGRFVTYAIEAEENSGQICLNGPAARLGRKGDLVIIIAYCHLTLDEMKSHKPIIIRVDESNRPL